MSKHFSLKLCKSPHVGRLSSPGAFLLFFMILISFLFFLVFSAYSDETQKIPENEKKFSRSECRWAVKWINSELSFFMGKGIVKKIISKDNFFEVRVGEAWYKLAFHEKGKLLQKLSRYREITGRSPFFDILDGESGEPVARVSERAIRILVQEEGFFQYLHSDEEKINTVY